MGRGAHAELRRAMKGVLVIRMAPIGRLFVGLMVASLVTLVSAQGFLSAEAVARVVSDEGPVLAESGDGVALLALTEALQLMARCTDTFAQPVKHNGVDYLYVHGHAVVSRRAWETSGALALEPAITTSTIRAYGSAAMWFQRVRVAYAAALAKVNREGDQWTELDEALTNSWTSSSQTAVAEWGSIMVSDDLIGGQRLGHEVYSLGEQGFCVFARWAFPADQSGFERQLNDPPGGSTGTPATGQSLNPTLPPGFVGGGFRDPTAP